MTARQISRLFFRHDAEAIPDPEARARAIAAADRQVNRRTLRPLKDSQLITVVRPFIIGETTPLARKEAVVLTAKGANVVRQLHQQQGRGRTLQWRRAWLAIDNTNQVHASLISDWYILLRRALIDDWYLAGWRDDRELAQLTQQGQTQLAGMVPDAAFILGRSAGGNIQHHPFLLELDLGTETVVSQAANPRDWTAKIERYLGYLAGDQHRDPLWTGVDPAPRVLTLTTSHERMDNLIAATRAAGGGAQFWFTTLDPLRGDRDPSLALWESRWRPASTDSPIPFRELVS